MWESRGAIVNPFRYGVPGSANVARVNKATERIPIGDEGSYAVQIDEMNFQIFSPEGKSLGLVWEVDGEPGVFRCVPTSNTGRPIAGGIHRSQVAAALHCIAHARL
jgi:hypothetical protein